MIFGLVGGIAGIIWPLLAYILDDYETFSYANALISSIYSTRPEGSSGSAIDKMRKSVSYKGQFNYGYLDYRFTSLIAYFCSCCCRKVSCFQRSKSRL